MYETAGFKRMADWPEGHSNVIFSKTLSER
jgi:hypothetical protein